MENRRKHIKKGQQMLIYWHLFILSSKMHRECDSLQMIFVWEETVLFKYWFFWSLSPSSKSVFPKGVSVEELERCSWIYGHLIGPWLGSGPNPATKREERRRVVKAPALFCAESTRTEGELFLIFFRIRQHLLSRGIRTEKWKKKCKRSLSWLNIIVYI